METNTLLSNFLSSFTPIDTVDLDDYVNNTATTIIGVNDYATTQSINYNKPYFNLDGNDILNINKSSTLTNNITVVGSIYNTNLTNQISDIVGSLENKSNRITLGGTFNFVLGNLNRA